MLTILFADIGGSASLYEKVGDAEAHRLIADSLARMKLAVQHNNGTVLRTVGDSVLASFESCDQAYLGAKSIQLNHQGLDLRVRVGFHTGSVIPDGGDVYGHAVNIAARVAEFARVDEIVATLESARRLSPEYRRFATTANEINVKGIPVPVAIQRLLWREDENAATRLASHQDYLTDQPAHMQLSIQYGATSLLAGDDLSDVTLGRADENHVAVTGSEHEWHLH